MSALSHPVEQVKKAHYAEEMIQRVRNTIQKSQEDDPESDPWDEAFGGVAWLDNEISMATELLLLLHPSRVFPDLAECKTVAEVKEHLVSFSYVELTFIQFVIEKGGSMVETFFELRNKSKTDILKEFEQIGYVFPNRICSLCQKEGKMRKCSGCMTTFYCSAECQKKDWTSHKKTCGH